MLDKFKNFFTSLPANLWKVVGILAAVVLFIFKEKEDIANKAAANEVEYKTNDATLSQHEADLKAQQSQTTQQTTNETPDQVAKDLNGI